MLILNGAAIATAQILIICRLIIGKTGLLPAGGILFAAALFSVGYASTFIPIESLTEAEYQTQPALIAFGKNAFLYFLPLGFVYGLLPFYKVIAHRLKEAKIISKLPSDIVPIKTLWLAITCAGTLVYSFFTTNYMLDRLNSSNEWHALFVSLIFLRTAVYFGLALSVVCWHHIYATRHKSVNAVR